MCTFWPSEIYYKIFICLRVGDLVHQKSTNTWDTGGSFALSCRSTPVQYRDPDTELLYSKICRTCSISPGDTQRMMQSVAKRCFDVDENIIHLMMLQQKKPSFAPVCISIPSILLECFMICVLRTLREVE